MILSTMSVTGNPGKNRYDIPGIAILDTKIKKNNSCHEEIVRNTLGLELDPYLISNLKRFLI